MENNKAAGLPWIFKVSYIIAFVIMAVNLAAHFLFLFAESGMITLRLGEWIQGWFFAYQLIWTIPLSYTSLLSTFLRERRLVALGIQVTMLIVTLFMTLMRMLVYFINSLVGVYEVLSWCYAFVMLVLLVLYVRSFIVHMKKNSEEAK